MANHKVDAGCRVVLAVNCIALHPHDLTNNKHNTAASMLFGKRKTTSPADEPPIVFSCIARDNVILVCAGQTQAVAQGILWPEEMGYHSFPVQSAEGDLEGLKLHFSHVGCNWIYAFVYRSGVLSTQDAKAYLKSLAKASTHLRESDYSWKKGPQMSCQASYFETLERAMAQPPRSPLSWGM